MEQELEDMESKVVIKKVNEPTEWVNSMVVNEQQSGKLIICIDPKDLNNATHREHYQLPTQKEITSRLAGAKCFSELDAKSGYWQMPLDEESSYLTTLNTPFGRYRFTVIVPTQSTANGVKPDEAKIKAIQEYTRPESKQDVLRLLGMVNFIAKFVPRISNTTAPLRELTRKNVEFHWIDQHEKAFNDLKRLLTEPGTLIYYDITKHVTVQVDASQRGLGAALSQDQGPVAYTSKVMNEMQQHYAQIEKELLVVVFGCKRFHQYIYGKK